MYCDTYPILPNRLSFREVFDQGRNSEIFYDKDNELLEKTIKSLKGYTKLENYSFLTKHYDWKNISNHYDQNFKRMIRKIHKICLYRDSFFFGFAKDPLTLNSSRIKFSFILNGFLP